MFPDLVSKFMNNLPNWNHIAEMMDFFSQTIIDEMKRRREQNVQRSDFLSYLIPTEKDLNDPDNEKFIEYDELGYPWLTNGLTKDEIVGQCVLFFLAGYETTATTLSMALFA